VTGQPSRRTKDREPHISHTAHAGLLIPDPLVNRHSERLEAGRPTGSAERTPRCRSRAFCELGDIAQIG
jgi:hypothetical protein